MLVSPRPSVVPFSHNLATIRPLVDSLYDSTRQSTALINQTHNELGLLLAVLSATEARSSLLYADRTPLALDSKLESCYAILLDVEKLQNNPAEIGLQARITELRARISSLVFELNVMNADMMICSQNKVNRLLGVFIEDVREGKRGHSVITDALNDDASPDSGKGQAWGNLQQELLGMGISSELSFQDHDFIISTLRYEVEEKDLMKNIKSEPTPLVIVEPPTIIVSSPESPTKAQIERDSSKPAQSELVEPPATIVSSPEISVAYQIKRESSPSLPPRPQDPGLSALSEKEVVLAEDLQTYVAPALGAKKAENESPPPLPPRPRDSGLSALSDKEVVVTKGSPNSAPIYTQGTSDTEKQVLPTDNYPIPVATEAFFNATGDSYKQALPRDNFPIPASTEFFTASNFTKQVVSRESISIPTTETNSSYHGSSHGDGNSNCNSNSSLSSTSPAKKPSIIHKMKYRLTNSKESFITAIQQNKTDTLKKALDKGANADTMNQDEQTALMVACSYGHEEIVKTLLHYGADADRSSDKGETALGVAAGRGQEGIVRVLLAHGASVNSYGRAKPGLSEAAASGYESIVRLLLDRGADPNAMRGLGLTALSRAAANGHVGVCRLLLDNGAKVDHPHSVINTSPLARAVESGQAGVVRLLMEWGADPLRRDVSGKTIVSLAVSQGRAGVIEIFRQHGYQCDRATVQYY
ncbi:unnamed protein product [Penicillium manginii]